MVDFEAQGLQTFPEWRGKLRVTLEKLGWAEAGVKDIQVALGDSDITQNMHEDELTLVFDKFSVFQ